MAETVNLLQKYVGVLRMHASRHAYLGLVIALVAVLLATVATALMTMGEVSPSALLAAQRNNVSLWIIDLMPFAFAFWGQYVSVIMAHEAGAIVLDATEDLRVRNQALETEARHHTTHDALTSLPNRTLFLDRLEQAIELAHESGGLVGTLVLNLDGFREINDTLGQHNGDRVLKSVARRLRSAVSEAATAARLGGDTYAVLLPRMDDREALVKNARRIGRSLAAPCALENLTIDLQACIGGAIFPDHGRDPDTLLNHADMAMREAKSTGNYFLVYRDQGKRVDPEALSLTAELRRAIQGNELVVYLQPIVAPHLDEPAGVEVLVRWPHPERGMIEPGEFIGRAERSGLILDLTHYVLAEALAHSRRFREAGHNLRFSVNVSVRVLSDPDFPDSVAGLLAANDLPGSSLTLEITEDTLMAERKRTGRVLERLGQMGVHISIDDFGTGYSQLAYLKRLPVREIKIDRSFVDDMLDSDTDRSIVAATIGLAKALDLRVVAEGVEKAEQAAVLTEMGCDLLQGYYFGRPMPGNRLETWLAEWRGGWADDLQAGSDPAT